MSKVGYLVLWPYWVEPYARRRGKKMKVHEIQFGVEGFIPLLRVVGLFWKALPIRRSKHV